MQSAFINRLCVCAALLGASTAQANLLTNGSFETGVFNPPNNDTVSLLVGSTQMTGWIVTDGSLSWIGAGNPFGLVAPDGSKMLDLTDYRDNPPYAGVSQTIATAIGAGYQLTFKLGSSAAYGQPVSLLASAGATQKLFTSTGVGNNLWEAESMTFTATATTTTIALRGVAGSQNIGLDNVDLIQVSAPVPEPGSLAMMALGLAGLGLLAAQRRRSA